MLQCFINKNTKKKIIKNYKIQFRANYSINVKLFENCSKKYILDKK